MEFKRMRMHPVFNIAVPENAVVIDVDNIVYWSDAFADEETFESFILGFEKLFGYGGLMASDPAVTMYASNAEGADILFVIDVAVLRNPGETLLDKIRRGEATIDLNKLGSLGYGFPTDAYEILMLVFDLAESVRNVIKDEEAGAGAWWEEQILEIVSYDTNRIVIGVNQAWLVDIGSLEQAPGETGESLDEDEDQARRSSIKH